MIETRSGPALAGVVSRGFGLPGIPCGNGGVYVRADKVVAWIESVTGRKLARAACDGHGDDPETAAVEGDAADGGGCSAGGGTELALGIALIAGVWRRRRGGARADRHDAARPEAPAGARDPGDRGDPVSAR